MTMATELKRKLQPRMSLPEPLELLFAWIEARGLFHDTPEGRIGVLFPHEDLRAGWTESERPGGTMIEFVAEGAEYLDGWYGLDRPEARGRLCVFAKTGADGSRAALWLDDQGQQRIVHIGSGSGSTLVCVLADNAIDFLRLVAIGYDELCWPESFDRPPEANSELRVHPNVEFREWVESTFGVSIPATARDIVHEPSEMDEVDARDPFCRWFRQLTA